MKTYEKIFDILSQADDYVNGEKIAQELGISRTSIWKAIQKLEKEGIQIESVKNRGYRLTAGDLLIPDWIEEHSPVQVSFNPDCQSTQMDAKAGMGPDARPTLFIWPLPNLLAVAVSVVPSSAPARAAFTCLSTSSPTSPSTSSLPILS